MKEKIRKLLKELDQNLNKPVKFLGEDWTFEYDSQPGTYYFSFGSDLIIYCTPGYDDAVLPIEITDSEGKVECDDLELVPKDFQDYIRVVEEYAKKYITPKGKWKGD